ncbi:MAG: AAA family ATPase [Candidatus Vogelbacteria bacterium]|nr:AAA family ATPase [Candidatus Vogelbacteria bacterium]
MIIGITGTLGAGKGTIAEYLVKQKGFKHYSARDFITEEIKKRGLSVERDNLVMVANDLRAKYGSAYVIEELYKQAFADGGDGVIESIRTIGEVETMKGKKDFYLLAIDAEIKSRYERIKKRASVTDVVTFEEFAEQEKREMSSTDPNKQNLAECIRQADYLITNDGAVEDLNKKIEEILQAIINK